MKQAMIPESVRKLLATAAVAATVFAVSSFAQSKNTGKPQLSIRANPGTGWVPFRTVLTAELTGGANDWEDYYCAKVEWDWGDDTRSEASYDCEPYEKGKSEIRRRFIQEHTFRIPGTYDVTFRLKQGTKIVGAAKITIQVRDEASAIRSSQLEVPSSGYRVFQQPVRAVPGAAPSRRSAA